MAALAEVTLLAMDTTEAISEPCRQVLSHILTTRTPAPGITIWSPRVLPSARLTSRLKFFNQTFLDMCDTVSFPDRTPAAVWPQSCTFLYRDTATQARASWDRLVQNVDKIHNGELLRASQVFLHISRAGRKKVMWTEIFAFTAQSSLVEFLIVETPLPDDFPVHFDSPASSFTVSAHLQHQQQQHGHLVPKAATSPQIPQSPPRSPQPLVEPPHAEDSVPSPLADADSQRWVAKQQGGHMRKRTNVERANFRCAECGEHETSQRRCARLAIRFRADALRAGEDPAALYLCVIVVACASASSRCRRSSSLRSLCDPPARLNCR